MSAPLALAPLETAVWAALDQVADPEIPTVSIVDLGIVRRVEATPECIRVELLPTFVGCPALEVMRNAVEEQLAPLAAIVETEISFAEPWSTERITERGHERLRESGFAPPARVADAPSERVAVPGHRLLPMLGAAACPFCGSQRTTLENAFGPTLCRAIAYCTDCRQPFEQFKAI